MCRCGFVQTAEKRTNENIDDYRFIVCADLLPRHGVAHVIRNVSKITDKETDR